MRIALLTRRFDPHGGGTERDLIVTANALAAAGHEVKTYAAEVRGIAQGLAVEPVRTLALGRSIDLLSFALRAPQIARREGRADLVLSFARTIGADVLRSGGGAHISYVRAARQWRGALAWAAMWASPYHRAQMAVERAGFRSPRLRLAIAVSEMVRADLIDAFGLAPETVVTLYNGVDLDRFTPARDDSARREIRARFGIPDSAPTAVFVGNGFARKGVPFLLKAWEKVTPGAHLLVIGGDRAIESYRSEANRRGLSSRVHFAGVQHDVASIFHGADAFTLPSLFEPFGNVVMEAMASGLPAMASSRSGVAELLPDPMKQFVVNDPTDTGEIARRMNLLLESHRELRQLARATAEKFTWERYARELNEIISRLQRPV